MEHRKTTFFAYCLAGLLLSAFPIAVSAQQPPESALRLSLTEAKQQLLDSMGRMYQGNYWLRKWWGSLELDPPEGIEVTEWTLKITFNFKQDGWPHKKRCSFQFSGLNYVDVTDIHSEHEMGIFFFVPMPDINDQDVYGDFVWRDSNDAKAFADALNRLIYHANGDEAEKATTIASRYEEALNEWRQAGASEFPALSEAANEERLLAEDAVKEKDFQSAVEHYLAALQIQPIWPAGWFNAGLIQGELAQYAEAISCMNRYLELLPNAEDASAAKDQITIWQHKLTYTQQ